MAGRFVKGDPRINRKGRPSKNGKPPSLIPFSQELKELCESLRNTSGVYSFWEEDIPLYIGKSRDLGKRITSSFIQNVSKYCHTNPTLKYIATNNSTASIIEVYLITTLNPSNNSDWINEDRPTIEINVPNFSMPCFILEYKNIKSLPPKPPKSTNMPSENI